MTAKSGGIILTACLFLLPGCAPKEYTVNGDVFIVARDGTGVKLAGITVAVHNRESIETWLKDVVPAIEAQQREAERLVAAASAELDQANADAKRASDIEAAARERVLKIRDPKAFVDADRKMAPLRREVADMMKLQMEKLDALFEAEQRVRAAFAGDRYLSTLPASSMTAKSDADGRFMIVVPRGVRIVLAASASRKLGKTTEQYAWLIPVDPPSAEATKVTLSNDNQTNAEGTTSLLKTRY